MLAELRMLYETGYEMLLKTFLQRTCQHLSLISDRFTAPCLRDVFQHSNVFQVSSVILSDDDVSICGDDDVGICSDDDVGICIVMMTSAFVVMLT